MSCRDVRGRGGGTKFGYDKGWMPGPTSPGSISMTWAPQTLGRLSGDGERGMGGAEHASPRGGHILGQAAVR